MSRPTTNLAGLLVIGAASWPLSLIARAIPAAYRISLWRAVCLLEDLAFSLRHPRRYRRLRAALGDPRLDRQRMVRLAVIIHARLAGQGIRARVYGRRKRVASIHRKMAQKGLALDRIHDVRALRVIVADVPTCYQALSVLQRCFAILPQHADDYIAHPKPNGYRSLHATILDAEGYSCEVQIRTPAMHRMAECGAAAHWRYKTGSSPPHPGPARAPSSRPGPTAGHRIRSG
jgi:GTP pyrophosphokinase